MRTKASFIWTFFKQKLRSCGENKECSVVSVSGKSEVDLKGESDSIAETLNIKWAIWFGQRDALRRYEPSRRLGSGGPPVTRWSTTRLILTAGRFLPLTTYFLFQSEWKNFQKMLSSYRNKSAQVVFLFSFECYQQRKQGFNNSKSFALQRGIGTI